VFEISLKKSKRAKAIESSRVQVCQHPKELLDVVDDRDTILGQAPRAKCHRTNLIHRSVMFYIFNTKGQIYITKRSMTKKPFSGYWSIVLGGHVPSGESYESAVIRELVEETALDCNTIYLDDFKKRTAQERENVKVFYLKTGKLPKLQKAELEFGEFVDISTLDAHFKKDNFLPETKILYEILMKNVDKL
jgi:isopentenyldiphosphate isomerase